MRKAYVKPTIECEVFVPNEYVAACGPTHYTSTGYAVKCETSGCGEVIPVSGSSDPNIITVTFHYNNEISGYSYTKIFDLIGHCFHVENEGGNFVAGDFAQRWMSWTIDGTEVPEEDREKYYYTHVVDRNNLIEIYNVS